MKTGVWIAIVVILLLVVYVVSKRYKKQIADEKIKTAVLSSYAAKFGWKLDPNYKPVIQGDTLSIDDPQYGNTRH